MGSKFQIPSELASLVPDFFRHREQDLIKLQKALQEKDYQAILFIGHNIKGIGGSYGFHEISEIGEKLEMAARLHHDKEMEFWITHLGTVVHDISQTILKDAA